MIELSKDDQALIDAIKVHAQDPRQIMLLAGRGCGAAPYPVAHPAIIERAERIIGFRLPSLIREIYLQVGNGGFGPGCGIGGLDDGCQIYDKTLTENCLEFRTLRGRLLEEAGFTEQELVDWKWDTHYIVYCYWGCNLTTIVDCHDPAMPVYSLDSITLKEHSSRTLRQWWKDWLENNIHFD